AVGGVEAARAQARGRGRLRSLHGRTLPPRDPLPALAARQGAAPVHLRSGQGGRRLRLPASIPRGDGLPDELNPPWPSCSAGPSRRASFAAPGTVRGLPPRSELNSPEDVCSNAP